MNISKLHYLSPVEANNLLSTIKNLKHRLLVLLMVDCGLRVSECISLRYSNFDFKDKTLHVKSLKKRDKQSTRIIPLSKRLYQELSNYLNLRKGIHAEDYLFPNPISQRKMLNKHSSSAGGGQEGAAHISRFAVNRMLSRLQYRNPVTSVNLHPHTLRHTFATQHLSAGTPIHNIKEMLGHASLNTTLIYAHIPIEHLRNNVETVTNPKSKVQKFFIRVFSPLHLWRGVGGEVNLHFRNTGIPTVGRNIILKQIFNNVDRGINTLILGNVGVGKSHLINCIKENFQHQCPPEPDTERSEPNNKEQNDTFMVSLSNHDKQKGSTNSNRAPRTPKLLTLDNTADLKPTLAQMLLYILKTDQKGVYDFLYPDYDYNKALAHISRDTVQNIANKIVEITAKKSYTLLIDNVDAITPKATKVLEIFKDHFTIVTTARSVAVNRSSFIWNFDVIRLKELDRDSAMKLIQAHSGGIQVQDYNLFRNHVFEQTNGNPRAIEEIITRYRKEPVITNAVIRQIRHTGALREIDCSFAILLFLACVACLRYLNHEVSNASFRVIGGIGLVFLFLSRYIFRLTRKTHV